MDIDSYPFKLYRIAPSRITGQFIGVLIDTSKTQKRLQNNLDALSRSHPNNHYVLAECRLRVISEYIPAGRSSVQAPASNAEVLLGAAEVNPEKNKTP